jgi:NAD(P)-dependent dehydrogenase (short-subunit alcohol dehydrogenase family)
MTNGDPFEGAVALITGANKGIGYEIARGLGVRKIVVLIGARNESRGQATAAKLKGEGIDARFVPLDVTSKETIGGAAQWIEDQFGHLDILVNNAGIGEWGSKPSDADLAKVREVYETNLFGPMAVTQAMLPLLRRSQHGRIVNVSSSLGSLTMANDPQSPISQFLALGYNTSKTALNSMTVQFANELRETPIKVNSVCPGYCATDINGHSGPRSAAQGAIAPVRYATLGDDGPSGGVFDEDGRVAW